MKINFKEFTFPIDVAQQTFKTIDVSKSLADGIYKQGSGVGALNLALKLYNSSGEEDYTDDECALIREYAQRFCTPWVIVALRNIFDNKATTNDDFARE